MPISEIVLFVDTAPSWPSRATAALDLAQRYGARLVGVSVRPPIDPFVYAEGAAAQVYAELQAIRERQLAEGAKLFRALVEDGAYRDKSEWRQVDQPVAAALATQGHYADFVVMSQGDPEANSGSETGLPAEVALASGGPVLVIPFKGAPQPIGRRVLVAWNGAREAIRAVRDAFGLLQEAYEIRVLTILEPGVQSTAAGDLARFLGRHAMRAPVDTCSLTGDLSVGDIILDYATARGSDLIVSGCYGHSRLREAILGGATRTFLRSMTVPLLMSH